MAILTTYPVQAAITAAYKPKFYTVISIEDTLDNVVYDHTYTRSCGDWANAEKKQAVIDRDNATCQYCGRRCIQPTPANGQGEWSIDHLFSGPFAGSHVSQLNYSWAVITTCRRCNWRKQSDSWVAWATHIARRLNQDPAQKVRQILTQLATPLDKPVYAKDLLYAPINNNGAIDTAILTRAVYGTSVKVPY